MPLYGPSSSSLHTFENSHLIWPKNTIVQQNSTFSSKNMLANTNCVKTTTKCEKKISSLQANQTEHGQHIDRCKNMLEANTPPESETSTNQSPTCHMPESSYMKYMNVLEQSLNNDFQYLEQYVPTGMSLPPEPQTYTYWAENSDGLINNFSAKPKLTLLSDFEVPPNLITEHYLPYRFNKKSMEEWVSGIHPDANDVKRGKGIGEGQGCKGEHQTGSEGGCRSIVPQTNLPISILGVNH